MPPKINGDWGNNDFGDNGGFKKFEIAPSYVGKLQGVTDVLNTSTLEAGLLYVREEEYLLFSEVTGETILREISDLREKAQKDYAEILLIYRCDCKASTTPCSFANTEEQIGLDASKCQLKQLDAGLATMIDANNLANNLKIYLFRIVVGKPDLKNHYIKFFEHLRTWKMDDGETLESQLSREISVIANPRFKSLFSVWLQDLAPSLETRFHPYEGCEAFGSRHCLLCSANFGNTVLEPCPLPIKYKTDPRHYYWSIFRKTFYTQLVRFLKRIPSY